MKIKFCGAASGVTGSCHLVTTNNHRILLDCGQFQGGKAQDKLNHEPFLFDAASIDCVVLSHAHIDHCGRLPLLYKRGFRGPIYCTSATADLLEVMLRDSGYIHEKEAEWKNKKAARNGGKVVEPLYTVEDSEAALQLVKPVIYDKLEEITPDIKIVFNDAGHILGSAITELWIKEDDKEIKLVFSGDLGMTNRPILRDPTIIKKADYVIMEATYGGRVHPENSTSIKKLLDIVIETTKRGGNVIIPSFAVGRTQELIYEFNKFYEEGGKYSESLENILVYIDSPMAKTATEVFRKNAHVFDDETKEYILSGDNPLDFKNLRFTRSTAESQSLNMDKTPKVIISASGMCEAGRIRHHLKHNLWDSRNSIVFVGYQGEGTLGRSLVEGIEEVILFGDVVKVNAEIHNLEGFSGHADQNGLFSWIAGFKENPKKLFIVHGEKDGKEAFGKLVSENLNMDVDIIQNVTEVQLDYTHVIDRDEVAPEPLEDEIIKVREDISTIHNDMEKILYNTDLSLSDNISEEKLVKINNLIQDLKKATLNLGATVTEFEAFEKGIDDRKV